MKNLIVALLSIVAIIFFVRSFVTKKAEYDAFEEKNAIIDEFNECFEASDWICAEKDVRKLLQESPDDENLQTHLAGLMFEQERYEECRRYIAGLKFSNPDVEFLDKKSESLLREMQELGIEKSMHFRVEFEGNLSRKDVMEALSVLEVAYDSLCHLFDFRPKNKMHLVLYQSTDYQGIGPRPDWVGAVFDGKLRVPVNVMEYREVYRPMLFHELTHAFVRAMTRAKVPLWLNEGLAQVVDASRNNEPRPDGGKPDLKMLTEPFVNQENKDIATKLYWYSQKMVEALLYRNGATYGSPEAVVEIRKLRSCIQELRNLDTDEALKKHFDLTSATLLERVN